MTAQVSRVQDFDTLDVTKSVRSRMSGAAGRLTALVESDMDRVNQTIVPNMQSDVALIPQLAGYLIASGGKRLRPLLTLASARLCGLTQGDEAINLATSVEFIHTATLLHDDVVDDSSLRRGAASANAVWGNKASVLVGDFLYSRAFQLMVADRNLATLKTLADASAVIASGEVAQLTTANDLGTNHRDYLDVIEAKTAALFAAACQVGAEAARAPEAEIEALRTYGHNLGMAFQLIDDALDYSADQEKLGKSVGDDFAEGKVTLPVLLAYEQGDADEQDFWRRTIERLDQNDGDLDRAKALIARHDAIAARLPPPSATARERRRRWRACRRYRTGRRISGKRSKTSSPSAWYAATDPGQGLPDQARCRQQVDPPGSTCQIADGRDHPQPAADAAFGHGRRDRRLLDQRRILHRHQPRKLSLQTRNLR